MGFSLRQAPTAVTGTNGPISITFASTPNQGNVVWVAVISFDGTATPPTVTVKDGNSNVYSATPNSPSLANSEAITAGAPWLFKLVAPSNASATITATYSGTTTFCAIAAAEFNVTGGTASFDVDAAGSGASGTNVNTPTINPTGAGELLFFLAGVAHTITSVNSPWTIAGSVFSGNAIGYILNGSSGGTAVNCTVNNSGAWEAMAGAFSFTASGGAAPNSRTLMGVGT